MTELTRYLVRKGSTDWMVWDRHARAPARLEEGRPATGLTEEQAREIKSRTDKKIILSVRLPARSAMTSEDHPAAKRTQARRLNIARHHLDTKAKRALIEAESSVRGRIPRAENSLPKSQSAPEGT
jgi:hypothetical protein